MTPQIESRDKDNGQGKHQSRLFDEEAKTEEQAQEESIRDACFGGIVSTSEQADNCSTNGHEQVVIVHYCGDKSVRGQETKQCHGRNAQQIILYLQLPQPKHRQAYRDQPEQDGNQAQREYRRGLTVEQDVGCAIRGNE